MVTPNEFLIAFCTTVTVFKLVTFIAALAFAVAGSIALIVLNILEKKEEKRISEKEKKLKQLIKEEKEADAS